MGYFQYCNSNGVGYSGPSGARAYLDYLATSAYYGVRMSPEATWALGAKAREFLGGPLTFVEWCMHYYPDWKPASPDVIPCAYGWYTFYGMPKAPEYQAWRDVWA
mgnify:CR=1 FL=1